MEAELINIQKLPDEVNAQALAICIKNVHDFSDMSPGAKTDIHRAVAEALSGVHHSDKVQQEPHRVCQNYAQMRNQEMASRIVGVVMPHWRGSVKSAAAIQVQMLLDRELTRMWNDVESFHHKYGLAYGGAPRVLPQELMDFRIKFMQEELDEYKRAWGDVRMDGDSLELRAEMLDALVDLVYVALGTAYLHGFNFAEAWRRVQVANMSKVRVERLEDSKRGSAFDVVKPSGWTPPSHIDLVGVLGQEPQAPSSGELAGRLDAGSGDDLHRRSATPLDWVSGSRDLLDAQLEAGQGDSEVVDDSKTRQSGTGHELF